MNLLRIARFCAMDHVFRRYLSTISAMWAAFNRISSGERRAVLYFRSWNELWFLLERMTYWNLRSLSQRAITGEQQPAYFSRLKSLYMQITQPGPQPEQPTQPQPQQPDIQIPNQEPAPPNVPDEIPERDIKRTPSHPNDAAARAAAHAEEVPADEKKGPTKDYNPHGKGPFKDRFPFPNTRH